MKRIIRFINPISLFAFLYTIAIHIFRFHIMLDFKFILKKLYIILCLITCISIILLKYIDSNSNESFKKKLYKDKKEVFIKPSIRDISISNDCTLKINLIPHMGFGYYHGPISLIDISKIQILYNRKKQEHSSFYLNYTNAVYNELMIKMKKCPNKEDLIEFNTKNGWCEDSSSNGNKRIKSNNKCPSIENKYVINLIDYHINSQ